MTNEQQKRKIAERNAFLERKVILCEVLGIHSKTYDVLSDADIAEDIRMWMVKADSDERVSYGKCLMVIWIKTSYEESCYECWKLFHCTPTQKIAAAIRVFEEIKARGQKENYETKK